MLRFLQCVSHQTLKNGFSFNSLQFFQKSTDVLYTLKCPHTLVPLHISVCPSVLHLLNWTLLYMPAVFPVITEVYQLSSKTNITVRLNKNRESISLYIISSGLLLNTDQPRTVHLQGSILYTMYLFLCDESFIRKPESSVLTPCKFWGKL